MSWIAVVVVSAVCSVGTGLLVAFVLERRTRTRIRTRIVDVTTRLATETLRADAGLDASLAQLERAVEAVVTKDRQESASKSRMAHALSATHDGIVLFADDGQIVFRNRCAEGFLDARHGDAIVESTIEELALAAMDGDHTTRTVELFGPPRRTLVLTSRSLDDGLRNIGALVVIEDVTERERVAAVRRDFVANISHELKTPVGGIGVLAETLVEEDDPPTMHRLAERMHLEAMRASRTIDDLLALTEIESAELSLTETASIHAVLAEAVDRASTAAEHRRITLDVIETAPNLEIRGDRRQLVSAVFNLLDNAIKYSAPDSTVTVSAAAQGDAVRLSVTDRGIGIPRRDLERIFERFYRVDRARSRETGGTGLGLAIVRHVAANHGGEVTVDSREGHGTTFTLTFPAVPESISAATRVAG